MHKSIDERPDIVRTPVIPNASLVRACWRFFSSMRAAIALLILLAVASIICTILGRRMDPMTASAMFSSGWYRALLSLVGLNLLVCSVNRFRVTLRRTFHPRVLTDAAEISSMRLHTDVAPSGSPEWALSAAAQALRERGLAVSSIQDAHGRHIYASRGAIALWGPYLTHVSLLVIFAGAAIGARFGFHGQVAIPESEIENSAYLQDTEEPRDLGFALKLDDFTIDHDADHNPTAYRSDLHVIDSGRNAAHKVIDVNSPLTYRHITFLQADYGLAGMTLTVSDARGNSAEVPFDISTQDTADGRVYQVSGEPFKQVDLGGRTVTVFVHGIAPDYVGGEVVNATSMPINPAAQVMVNDRLPRYRGLDAWQNVGWLQESESAVVGNYTITLASVRPYTVLQVEYNPGLPIVFAGFALILVAVVLSFYVTHRVVRVCIAETESGSMVYAGVTCKADLQPGEDDLEHLRKALTRTTDNEDPSL